MGASSSVAARQVTPLLLRALATMTGSLHTPSSPHTHPSSSHTRLLCGTVECATLKALDTWFAYRVPSGYLTADGLHPTPFLTTTRTHMPPSRAFFSPTAEWRTLLTGDRRALAELLALDDATARALYINRTRPRASGTPSRPSSATSLRACSTATRARAAPTTSRAPTPSTAPTSPPSSPSPRSLRSTAPVCALSPHTPPPLCSPDGTTTPSQCCTTCCATRTAP